MIIIGKFIELNNDYEYRHVTELEGVAQNYIKIPSSIILDTEMRNNRVAIFSYLSMYKGIHSRMILSMPALLKWSGYINDPRDGGVNDKFLETLDSLSDYDYLIYMANPTRTACIEVEFNTQKVFETCFSESFAIMYVDEIERIMKHKNNNPEYKSFKNTNVLLVFAYLRHVICRVPNKLKPEQRNPEGIKKRREALVEAFATNYKDIGEQIGLSERIVAKAVRVLQELKLIVIDECYRVKNELGEFRTPYIIFANYEKRDGKYLLTAGLDYARNEMERKVEKIREYGSDIYINKNKRKDSLYLN